MAHVDGGRLAHVARIALVAMVAAPVIAFGALRHPAPASGEALTSEVSGGSRTDRAEAEFIDLGYWEEFLIEGYSFTRQPSSECDRSDPDVLVCTYELSGQMRATHIGRASEVQSGTITTDLTETCTQPGGATGNPEIRLGDGIITSQAGDQIFFRNQARSCSGLGTDGGYWTVTEGTGRFEDASGTMSAVVVLRDGILTFSAGTLTVRGDLWDGILPPPPPVVITPGALSLDEGNAGQVTVDVPVTLSAPSDEPVTVDWATLDTGAPGIATADVDYVAASGTLSFAPGETESSIPIAVNGDTEIEPAGLFGGELGLVRFSNPSANAEIDTNTFYGLGLFVIVDDD